MKRLDQGHLHSKLEVSRLTCPDRELIPVLSGALQRTNTKTLNQIFPEKELCGHSPNLHIHGSVSDLYIPKVNLLQEICGPILGIYKSLTNTWMWKLGLWPRNPEKEYINGIFVAVWEASTLKSLTNSLYNCYSELYSMLISCSTM